MLAIDNAGLWVAATKICAPLQNARRLDCESQILTGMLIMVHMPKWAGGPFVQLHRNSEKQA